MASGAATAAAVAVFAVLVLSSLGHPKTGPLCSDCGSLCNTNCTAEAASACSGYCDNPYAARQECERHVLQQCQATYCSNGTCSRDCNLEAQNGCQYVSDTVTDCQACKGGTFQSCYPPCESNCNSTCVKKEDGC